MPVSYTHLDVYKRQTLRESDLVVGNLETVFAGEEAGYTNDVYSFNTPDRFVCSMKSAGIDLSLIHIYVR